MDTSKCCLFSTIFFILICSIKCEKALEFNSTDLPNQGICYTMDIRNYGVNLARLENCTVIIGFLRIVLLHRDEDLSAYSFPNLREITQYLVFYNVKNFINLGNLFPNLMLIRGNSLMMHYALVIFDMPRLRELGLNFLRVIQHGAVRIERNPELCLTETVHWDRITEDPMEGNFLAENGHHLCPSFDVCRGCDGYCWSSKFCQKFPSDSCDSECLGGCTHKGLCFRCKNFSDNGFCVSSCPPDKYIVPEAMICVTEEQCSSLYGDSGWIFENQCIRNCAFGFEDATINGTKTCVICGAKCSSTCESMVITNLNDLESYEGCHYVNGSLNIQIMEQITEEDITYELERFLGSIIEIRDFLRVVKSETITSLNFLKNLTIIHGERLWYNTAAFVVHEMNNLQSIFDWKVNQKFTIKKGRLSFHDNAKLCMKEIQTLSDITKVEFDEFEVSNISNGYEQFCEKSKIIAKVDTVEKTYAAIAWKRFNWTDIDKNENPNSKGYIINYIKSDDDNITAYHSINSCIQKKWKVIFVAEPQEFDSDTISHVITDLVPCSKYAVFIHTHDANKDRRHNSASDNGESDVLYFKTQVDRIPMPTLLEAISFSPDSITIFWTFPPQYSDAVAQHLIEAYILLDDQEFYDSNNYCLNIEKEPIVEKKEEKCSCPIETLSKESSSSAENDVFDCDEVRAETEVGSYADFQRDLFCGYTPFSYQRRTPRSANKDFYMYGMLNLDSYKHKPTVENVLHNNRYYGFSAQFSGEYKNYTLKNLKHFGKYVISVTGCIQESGEVCGMPAITAHRTMKNAIVDKVTTVSASIANSSHVKIEWDEPEDPNGVILSYFLQYKRLDIDPPEISEVCITRLEHERNGSKFHLWNLNPGHYSFRIKAMSIGSEGIYTDWINFTVPESLSTILVLCLLSAGLVAFAIAVYILRLKIKNNFDDIDALMTPEVFRPTMGVRYETDVGNEVEFYNSY